jgi:hypothetical protein
MERASPADFAAQVSYPHFQLDNLAIHKRHMSPMSERQPYSSQVMAMELDC